MDIYKSYIKMNSIQRNCISEEYSTKLFDEGIRYRGGSADRFVENGVNRYEFNYVIYNAVFEKMEFIRYISMRLDSFGGGGFSSKGGFSGGGRWRKLVEILALCTFVQKLKLINKM